jgi:hypothetical protein
MGRIPFLIVAVGLSALTGCAGGAGSQEETALAPLVRDTLLAEKDESAIRFDQTEAECIASGVTTELSPERLTQIGFNSQTNTRPKDPTALQAKMNPEDARVFVAAMDRCSDLEAKVALILERDGVATAAAVCIADKYAASGLMHESLRSLKSDPGLNRRVDEALGRARRDCGV